MSNERRLEGQKATLKRDDNGLRAVTCMELLKDVLHVHLDGVFGDEEQLCGFLVALSLGDKGKDFNLAFTERTRAYVAREFFGGLGRERFAAGDYVAKLLGEGSTFDALEQITASSGGLWLHGQMRLPGPRSG